jgi:sortase A
MTDAPPATRRRRLVRAVLAAGLVATLGVTGWSPGTEDTSSHPTALQAPAATTLTTDPAPAPPSTPPPAPPSTLPATDVAALPVPEGAPTDPRAPTPEVVHGTLALPTLGVSQPFGEGVTLTAIDRGPSHWPGTAMPGQQGNVVVAGHRVTRTRPFYDLDLLRPGDPLVFTMHDGTVWHYVHTGTTLVGPDATHIVQQTTAHTATLFACHPKGSAAQRIVATFVLA